MKILEDLEKLTKATERINNPDIEMKRIREMQRLESIRRGT